MYLIVLALRQLGESSGYASDLRHFLDLPEYSTPSADPTKNTRPFPKPLRHGIVAKNVTYTYPGSETPALPQSEPSKSTLAKKSPLSAKMDRAKPPLSACYWASIAPTQARF